MKKIIIFSIIIIAHLSLTIICNAETTENSINKLYLDYKKILYSENNQDLAIDYAINILKKAPESVEAYRTMTIIRDIEVTEKLRQKYNNLMDLYFKNLNDINSNTAEKIVLIRLILMGFYKFKSHEDSREKDKICDKTLLKIKNECKNKNYSAIALHILFLSQFKGEECMKEFLRDYPNHPAIPYVDLELNVGIHWLNYTSEIEAKKGLEKAQIYLKKYSDVITPDGPRFVLGIYSLIATFYSRLNDRENALKYYNLIKNECPTDPDLTEIENEIKNIKNKH